jgi:hypothetical protein
VRIVVVKRPILTQVRPLYSYVGREDNEIFLTGGEYPSSEKGGDFWDTALYDYLWCSFTTTVAVTETTTVTVTETITEAEIESTTETET